MVSRDDAVHGLMIDESTLSGIEKVVICRMNDTHGTICKRDVDVMCVDCIITAFQKVVDPVDAAKL